MKALIKRFANKFGYDILHLPVNPFKRGQIELLNKFNIEILFDIGANTGQFSKAIRKIGYKKKIISFEPFPEAYSILSENAKNDSFWETYNCAIGNIEGFIDMNISENLYSNSILDILPAHVESAPDSVYKNKILVPICTLDSFIEKTGFETNNLFVKIDTQGYERHVFEGCARSLNKIAGFQLELSIVHLYSGESLMHEMIDLLRAHGYKLQLIESGHRNYTTGEILQLECVFYK